MSRTIFKRLLPALFLVFLVGVALAWAIGSRLIEPANHAVPLPVGFPAQVVSIQGVGHAVAGWWVDQGSGSPVVLLLHGIRADRSSMVGRAQLLMRHGFSVLLIDLQAHGETPGEAITMGFRESADVVAARDWIRRTYPQRRIGVIGCSMGGAAILLGPQPSGFDAVVLEAVYPRAQRAIENRIRLHLGPLAPLLTPLLTMQIQPRLRVSASALAPIRSIGKLGAPLLVVAGSRDARTTLAESMELFAAATEPKSLWVVDGARHQDFLAYDPRGYDAHVVEFLIETLAPVANAAMDDTEINRSAVTALALDEFRAAKSQSGPILVDGDLPNGIEPRFQQFAPASVAVEIAGIALGRPLGVGEPKYSVRGDPVNDAPGQLVDLALSRHKNQRKLELFGVRDPTHNADVG